jgi:hypothetical protein
LRLTAELHDLNHAQADTWRAAVTPVAELLAARTADYLRRLTVPIRSGTHSSTAFAMAHMLDYARVAGDRAFAAKLEKRARDFFLDDTDCPTAYEPSGEDFISPCLAEADLMRRVLPADGFRAWLTRFLPSLAAQQFASLRAPVEVRDLKDPRIGHLIGLAFQRAWCFDGIARTLPDTDLRRAVFIRLSHIHQHEAIAQMLDSGYGGEHWLASFALFSLSEPRPLGK